MLAIAIWESTHAAALARSQATPRHNASVDSLTILTITYSWLISGRCKRTLTLVAVHKLLACQVAQAQQLASFWRSTLTQG
jgi:hypothetical protein